MKRPYFWLMVSRSSIAIGLLFLFSTATTAQDSPNILLIIADDLGVDFTHGYDLNLTIMPHTPHLDELRANGLTFKNAWSAPQCTPTRASIMSGKYGIKTGILSPPGNLDLEHSSIFTELADRTENRYADALIGKWHLSRPVNYMHPEEHGIDHYEGIFNSGVEDYYEWTKVTNGVVSTETEYVTTDFTTAAINWINEQDGAPWFLWLAHAAPHAPFHVPPESLYTISSTNSNAEQYIAMIEAMDYEIGRLLDNIPPTDLDNTVIIFIGDNGTPGGVNEVYPNRHAKGSPYQGGIHVPLIVSGVGVERRGEEEDALVHAADLYATLLELAGEELPGGIYNSLSFAHLLDDSGSEVRPYNYSDWEDGMDRAWMVRNHQFKLIKFDDGTEEFYDILLDPLEMNDLISGGLHPDLVAIKNELTAEGEVIRSAWSCNDLIRNGDEEGIDCGGSSCAPCTISSTLEPAASALISAYPNPAFDQLNILAEDQVLAEIRVYDSLGKLLQINSGLNASVERLSMEHFPIGLLLLEVKTSSGTAMIKVVNQ